jgi:hypothetical protein
MVWPRPVPSTALARQSLAYAYGVRPKPIRIASSIAKLSNMLKKSRKRHSGISTVAKAPRPSRQPQIN